MSKATSNHYRDLVAPVELFYGSIFANPTYLLTISLIYSIQRRALRGKPKPEIGVEPT